MGREITGRNADSNWMKYQLYRQVYTGRQTTGNAENQITDLKVQWKLEIKLRY